jgi:hypothetical protein
MTREEDICHTLGRILEKTRAILIPAERVTQLLREFIPDATEAETVTELQFLIGRGWVQSVPDSCGGTLRYQLTAEGILARRRNEL